MTGDGFRFDLKAKRTRLSDSDLVAGLQSAAKEFGGSYFTSLQYDDLPGKRPHSATIIERFGSWKKALALLGISGGRERRYSPEELIANLEAVWKRLGVPPARRQIASLGERISEGPYKRHWGSVRAACEALAAFHGRKLSREVLLAGKAGGASRRTIALQERWAVLKRARYRCSRCGASPSGNSQVELEVDHIIPVANGGTNERDNLQALCRACNQGKKDR